MSGLLEYGLQNTSGQSRLRHSRPSASATQVVESIIVLIVQSVIWCGGYVSVFEVGVGWLWCREKRYLTSAIQVVFFSILIPAISMLHIYLSSGRSSHNVPHYLAPNPSTITKPYESLSDGSLSFCTRGSCNSRWKPPGTHHCSTCGVCRLNFDHHCPWLGNCVSAARLKAFLILLISTSIVVPVGIIPVRHKLLQHVYAAITASQADPWISQNWWGRWYSWVFVGGPPGRWLVGTILGYNLLKQNRPNKNGSLWFDGFIIEYPHLRLVLIAFAASLLSIFAFAMALVTTRDVLKGQTAYSSRVRISRRGRVTGKFVTLPFPDNTHGVASGVDLTKHQNDSRSCPPVRQTYAVLPGERLYDLGWRDNWAKMWKTEIFPSQPCTRLEYEWPTINRSILKRLNKLSEP